VLFDLDQEAIDAVTNVDAGMALGGGAPEPLAWRAGPGGPDGPAGRGDAEPGPAGEGAA
jgi:hypothetical protein